MNPHLGQSTTSLCPQPTPAALAGLLRSLGTPRAEIRHALAFDAFTYGGCPSADPAPRLQLLLVHPLDRHGREHRRAPRLRRRRHRHHLHVGLRHVVRAAINVADQSKFNTALQQTLAQCMPPGASGCGLECAAATAYCNAGTCAVCSGTQCADAGGSAEDAAAD
jgi:hypothetical protein